MKAIKIITALVLVAGFTSLSHAGPGPDYWNRMNQAAKDKAALTARVQATTQPAIQAASCASCSCCAKKA